MQSFFKKLLGKFIKIDVIRESPPVLADVDFTPKDNQLPDEQIFIGLLTREKIQSLEEEGDISPRERQKFGRRQKEFASFEMAGKETVKKQPCLDNDDILQYARLVNFEERGKACFEDVLFFIKRYQHLLPYQTAQHANKVQKEFTEYQLLDKSDIPHDIWDQSLVKDDDGGSFHRMDIIWGYLSSVRLAGGSPKFGALREVAKLVLVIPHSNAGEEMVFSMIRKNKTDFRNPLSVNGTLSSLITIKMAQPVITTLLQMGTTKGNPC